MLKEAALPPLQSLLDGPSTVFWVATYISAAPMSIATNFVLILSWD